MSGNMISQMQFAQVGNKNFTTYVTSGDVKLRVSVGTSTKEFNIEVGENPTITSDANFINLTFVRNLKELEVRRYLHANITTSTATLGVYHTINTNTRLALNHSPAFQVANKFYVVKSTEPSVDVVQYEFDTYDVNATEQSGLDAILTYSLDADGVALAPIPPPQTELAFRINIDGLGAFPYQLIPNQENKIRIIGLNLSTIPTIQVLRFSRNARYVSTILRGRAMVAVLGTSIYIATIQENRLRTGVYNTLSDILSSNGRASYSIASGSVSVTHMAVSRQSLFVVINNILLYRFNSFMRSQPVIGAAVEYNLGEQIRGARVFGSALVTFGIDFTTDPVIGRVVTKKISGTDERLVSETSFAISPEYIYSDYPWDTVVGISVNGVIQQKTINPEFQLRAVHPQNEHLVSQTNARVRISGTKLFVGNAEVIDQNVVAMGLTFDENIYYLTISTTRKSFIRFSEVIIYRLNPDFSIDDSYQLSYPVSDVSMDDFHPKLDFTPGQAWLMYVDSTNSPTFASFALRPGTLGIVRVVSNPLFRFSNSLTSFSKTRRGFAVAGAGTSTTPVVYHAILPYSMTGTQFIYPLRSLGASSPILAPPVLSTTGSNDDFYLFANRFPSYVTQVSVFNGSSQIPAQNVVGTFRLGDFSIVFFPNQTSNVGPTGIIQTYPRALTTGSNDLLLVDREVIGRYRILTDSSIISDQVENEFMAHTEEFIETIHATQSNPVTTPLYRSTSTSRIDLSLLLVGSPLLESANIGLNLDYAPGVVVRISATSNARIFVLLNVTEYDRQTGLFNGVVQEIAGTGSFDSWNVNLDVQSLRNESTQNANSETGRLLTMFGIPGENFTTLGNFQTTFNKPYYVNQDLKTIFTSSELTSDVNGISQETIYISSIPDAYFEYLSDLYDGKRFVRPTDWDIYRYQRDGSGNIIVDFPGHAFNSGVSIRLDVLSGTVETKPYTITSTSPGSLFISTTVNNLPTSGFLAIDVFVWRKFNPVFNGEEVLDPRGVPAGHAIPARYFSSAGLRALVEDVIDKEASGYDVIYSYQSPYIRILEDALREQRTINLSDVAFFLETAEPPGSWVPVWNPDIEDGKSVNIGDPLGSFQVSTYFHRSPLPGRFIPNEGKITNKVGDVIFTFNSPIEGSVVYERGVGSVVLKDQIIARIGVTEFPAPSSGIVVRTGASAVAEGGMVYELKAPISIPANVLARLKSINPFRIEPFSEISEGQVVAEISYTNQSLDIPHDARVISQTPTQINLSVDFFNLKSNFNGIVNYTEIARVGNLVNAGDRLATITYNQPLEPGTVVLSPGVTDGATVAELSPILTLTVNGVSRLIRTPFAGVLRMFGGFNNLFQIERQVIDAPHAGIISNEIRNDQLETVATANQTVCTIRVNTTQTINISWEIGGTVRFVNEYAINSLVNADDPFATVIFPPISISFTSPSSGIIDDIIVSKPRTITGVKFNRAGTLLTMEIPGQGIETGSRISVKNPTAVGFTSATGVFATGIGGDLFTIPVADQGLTTGTNLVIVVNGDVPISTTTNEIIEFRSVSLPVQTIFFKIEGASRPSFQITSSSIFLSYVRAIQSIFRFTELVVEKRSFAGVVAWRNVTVLPESSTDFVANGFGLRFEQMYSAYVRQSGAMELRVYSDFERGRQQASISNPTSYPSLATGWLDRLKRYRILVRGGITDGSINVVGDRFLRRVTFNTDTSTFSGSGETELPVGSTSLVATLDRESHDLFVAYRFEGNTICGRFPTINRVVPLQYVFSDIHSFDGVILLFSYEGINIITQKIPHSLLVSGVLPAEEISTVGSVVDARHVRSVEPWSRLYIVGKSATVGIDNFRRFVFSKETRSVDPTSVLNRQVEAREYQSGIDDFYNVYSVFRANDTQAWLTKLDEDGLPVLEKMLDDNAVSPVVVYQENFVYTTHIRKISGFVSFIALYVGKYDSFEFIRIWEKGFVMEDNSTDSFYPRLQVDQDEGVIKVCLVDQTNDIVVQTLTTDGDVVGVKRLTDKFPQIDVSGTNHLIHPTTELSFHYSQGVEYFVYPKFVDANTHFLVNIVGEDLQEIPVGGKPRNIITRVDENGVQYIAYNIGSNLYLRRVLREITLPYSLSNSVLTITLRDHGYNTGDQVKIIHPTISTVSDTATVIDADNFTLPTNISGTQTGDDIIIDDSWERRISDADNQANPPGTTVNFYFAKVLGLYITRGFPLVFSIRERYELGNPPVITRQVHSVIYDPTGSVVRFFNIPITAFSNDVFEKIIGGSPYIQFNPEDPEIVWIVLPDPMKFKFNNQIVYNNYEIMVLKLVEPGRPAIANLEKVLRNCHIGGDGNDKTYGISITDEGPRECCLARYTGNGRVSTKVSLGVGSVFSALNYVPYPDGDEEEFMRNLEKAVFYANSRSRSDRLEAISKASFALEETRRLRGSILGMVLRKIEEEIPGKSPSYGTNFFLPGEVFPETSTTQNIRVRVSNIASKLDAIYGINIPKVGIEFVYQFVNEIMKRITMPLRLFSMPFIRSGTNLTITMPNHNLLPSSKLAVANYSTVKFSTNGPAQVQIIDLNTIRVQVNDSGALSDNNLAIIFVSDVPGKTFNNVSYVRNGNSLRVTIPNHGLIDDQQVVINNPQTVLFSTSGPTNVNVIDSNTISIIVVNENLAQVIGSNLSVTATNPFPTPQSLMGVRDNLSSKITESGLPFRDNEPEVILSLITRSLNVHFGTSLNPEETLTFFKIFVELSSQRMLNYDVDPSEVGLVPKIDTSTNLITNLTRWIAGYADGVITTPYNYLRVGDKLFVGAPVNRQVEVKTVTPTGFTVESVVHSGDVALNNDADPADIESAVVMYLTKEYGRPVPSRIIRRGRVETVINLLFGVREFKDYYIGNSELYTVVSKKLISFNVFMNLEIRKHNPITLQEEWIRRINFSDDREEFFKPRISSTDDTIFVTYSRQNSKTFLETFTKEGSRTRLTQSGLQLTSAGGALETQVTKFRLYGSRSTGVYGENIDVKRRLIISVPRLDQATRSAVETAIAESFALSSDVKISEITNTINLQGLSVNSSFQISSVPTNLPYRPGDIVVVSSQENPFDYIQMIVTGYSIDVLSGLVLFVSGSEERTGWNLSATYRLTLSEELRRLNLTFERGLDIEESIRQTLFSRGFRSSVLEAEELGGVFSTTAISLPTVGASSPVNMIANGEYVTYSVGNTIRMMRFGNWDIATVWNGGIPADLDIHNDVPVVFSLRGSGTILESRKYSYVNGQELVTNPVTENSLISVNLSNVQTVYSNVISETLTAPLSVALLCRKPWTNVVISTYRDTTLRHRLDVDGGLSRKTIRLFTMSSNTESFTTGIGNSPLTNNQITSTEDGYQYFVYTNPSNDLILRQTNDVGALYEILLDKFGRAPRVNIVSQDLDVIVGYLVHRRGFTDSITMHYKRYTQGLELIGESQLLLIDSFRNEYFPTPFLDTTLFVRFDDTLRNLELETLRESARFAGESTAIPSRFIFTKLDNSDVDIVDENMSITTNVLKEGRKTLRIGVSPQNTFVSYLDDEDKPYLTSIGNNGWVQEIDKRADNLVVVGDFPAIINIDVTGNKFITRRYRFTDGFEIENTELPYSRILNSTSVLETWAPYETAVVLSRDITGNIQTTNGNILYEFVPSVVSPATAIPRSAVTTSQYQDRNIRTDNNFIEFEDVDHMTKAKLRVISDNGIFQFDTIKVTLVNVVGGLSFSAPSSGIVPGDMVYIESQKVVGSFAVTGVNGGVVTVIDSRINITEPVPESHITKFNHRVEPEAFEAASLIIRMVRYGFRPVITRQLGRVFLTAMRDVTGFFRVVSIVTIRINLDGMKADKVLVRSFGELDSETFHPQTCLVGNQLYRFLTRKDGNLYHDFLDTDLMQSIHVWKDGKKAISPAAQKEVRLQLRNRVIQVFYPGVGGLRLLEYSPPLELAQKDVLVSSEAFRVETIIPNKEYIVYETVEDTLSGPSTTISLIRVDPESSEIVEYDVVDGTVTTKDEWKVNVAMNEKLGNLYKFDDYPIVITGKNSNVINFYKFYDQEKLGFGDIIGNQELEENTPLPSTLISIRKTTVPVYMYEGKQIHVVSEEPWENIDIMYKPTDGEFSDFVRRTQTVVYDKAPHPFITLEVDGVERRGGQQVREFQVVSDETINSWYVDHTLEDGLRLTNFRVLDRLSSTTTSENFTGVDPNGFWPALSLHQSGYALCYTRSLKAFTESQEVVIRMYGKDNSLIWEVVEKLPDIVSKISSRNKSVIVYPVVDENQLAEFTTFKPRVRVVGDVVCVVYVRFNRMITLSVRRVQDGGLVNRLINEEFRPVNADELVLAGERDLFVGEIEESDININIVKYRVNLISVIRQFVYKDDDKQLINPADPSSEQANVKNFLRMSQSSNGQLNVAYQAVIDPDKFNGTVSISGNVVTITFENPVSFKTATNTSSHDYAWLEFINTQTGRTVRRGRLYKILHNTDDKIFRVDVPVASDISVGDIRVIAKDARTDSRGDQGSGIYQIRLFAVTTGADMRKVWSRRNIIRGQEVGIDLPVRPDPTTLVEPLEPIFPSSLISEGSFIMLTKVFAEEIEDTPGDPDSSIIALYNTVYSVVRNGLQPRTDHYIEVVKGPNKFQIRFTSLPYVLVNRFEGWLLNVYLDWESTPQFYFINYAVGAVKVNFDSHGQAIMPPGETGYNYWWRPLINLKPGAELSGLTHTSGFEQGVSSGLTERYHSNGLIAETFDNRRVREQARIYRLIDGIDGSFTRRRDGQITVTVASGTFVLGEDVYIRFKNDLEESREFTLTSASVGTFTVMDPMRKEVIGGDVEVFRLPNTAEIQIRRDPNGVIRVNNFPNVSKGESVYLKGVFSGEFVVINAGATFFEVMDGRVIKWNIRGQWEADYNSRYLPSRKRTFQEPTIPDNLLILPDKTAVIRTDGDFSLDGLNDGDFREYYARKEFMYRANRTRFGGDGELSYVVNEFLMYISTIDDTYFQMRTYRGEEGLVFTSDLDLPVSVTPMMKEVKFVRNVSAGQGLRTGVETEYNIDVRPPPPLKPTSWSSDTPDSRLVSGVQTVVVNRQGTGIATTLDFNYLAKERDPIPIANWSFNVTGAGGSYVIRRPTGRFEQNRSNVRVLVNSNPINLNIVKNFYPNYINLSGVLTGINNIRVEEVESFNYLWGTDSTWNSIAFGNGMFVAVGIGAVMYSEDSIVWERGVPSSEINTWKSVIYAEGQFVSVASLGVNDRIMTSPDGITWTRRPIPLSNAWTSITHGNGLYVVVGATGFNNRVITSTDGVIWNVGSGIPNEPWTSVTFGDSFVAVASSGEIMRSIYGYSWTKLTNPVIQTGSNISIRLPNNAVLTGLSFSFLNLDLVVTIPGHGLVFGQEVSIENSFAVNISLTDRKIVSTTPNTITLAAERSGGPVTSWSAVTFGNGVFVAVSNQGTNGGRVITSPDGLVWTPRAAPAANWTSVTFGNGIFMAVARNICMTSADGISWTLLTIGVANDWSGVVFGNGVFAAVSQTGSGNRVATTNDSGVTWIPRISAPVTRPQNGTIVWNGSNKLLISYFDIPLLNRSAIWSEIRNGDSVIIGDPNLATQRIRLNVVAAVVGTSFLDLTVGISTLEPASTNINFSEGVRVVFVRGEISRTETMLAFPESLFISPDIGSRMKLSFDIPFKSEYRILTNFLKSSISGLVKAIVTMPFVGVSYTRSGTVLTATIPDHGFSTGNILSISNSVVVGFSISGNGALTKINDDSFTLVVTSTGSTSGTNLSLSFRKPIQIQAGFNNLDLYRPNVQSLSQFIPRYIELGNLPQSQGYIWEFEVDGKNTSSAGQMIGVALWSILYRLDPNSFRGTPKMSSIWGVDRGREVKLGLERKFINTVPLYFKKSSQYLEFISEVSPTVFRMRDATGALANHQVADLDVENRFVGYYVQVGSAKVLHEFIYQEVPDKIIMRRKTDDVITQVMVTDILFPIESTREFFEEGRLRGDDKKNENTLYRSGNPKSTTDVLQYRASDISFFRIDNKFEVDKPKAFFKYTELNEDGTMRSLYYLDEQRRRENLFIDYSDRGVEIARGMYSEGVKTGVWNYHYVSGRLRESGEYNNNNRVGEWSIYYDTPPSLTQILWEKIVYSNVPGQNTSVFQGPYELYYFSGNLKEEGVYARVPMGLTVKAVRTGEWKTYHDLLTESGTKVTQDELNYDNGRLNGEYKSYYPSGRIREKGMYDMDVRTSTWRTFYDVTNGEEFKIKEETNYVNGVLSGSYKLYYAPRDTELLGRINVSGSYINGLKSGKWITSFNVDEDVTQREENFTENLLNGAYKLLISPGIIKEEGAYSVVDVGYASRSLRSGVWKFYQGEFLTSEGGYIRGDKVGLWKYYRRNSLFINLLEFWGPDNIGMYASIEVIKSKIILRSLIPNQVDFEDIPVEDNTLEYTLDIFLNRAPVRLNTIIALNAQIAEDVNGVIYRFKLI